jgi:hypothetical protein
LIVANAYIIHDGVKLFLALNGGPAVANELDAIVLHIEPDRCRFFAPRIGRVKIVVLLVPKFVDFSVVDEGISYLTLTFMSTSQGVQNAGTKKGYAYALYQKYVI